MGILRRWFLAALLAVGHFPGVAWAANNEVDVLLDKLVEKGILSPVEAGQVRREIEETKPHRYKELAKEIVPEPARNWKWKGDIRLRDEYRNRVGTGADSHRFRIRFRYGVEAKVSDQLKVVGRLATGTSADSATPDPVSTNDSFDDFFRKKPFNLDLAYVEYKPEVPGLKEVKARGGIMENPLWTVTPMVWDSDLSWDGVSAHLTHEAGPVMLFSNGGVFSLDTEESETASLWVAQSGLTVSPFQEAEAEFLKELKMTGALAYHDYKNTANSAKAGTDPITRESDNTNFSDFNQVNPSLEIATKLAGYPTSLFADWVHNTSASSRGNDGYAYGVKVGKATTPWSLKDGWETGYMYEWLERDAAFDEFVDSDFGGGGTNRHGNVVWVTLATLKNSTIGAKYFFMQEAIKNSSAAPKFREDRLQLDWVTKF